MKNNKILNLRLPGRILDRIRDFAAAEEESTAAMARVLIREAIKWREIHAPKGVQGDSNGKD